VMRCQARDEMGSFGILMIDDEPTITLSRQESMTE
jgi:hypothetical protein